MKHILKPFTWVISLLFFIVMVLISTLILLLLGISSSTQGQYSIAVKMDKTLKTITTKRGIK